MNYRLHIHKFMANQATKYSSCIDVNIFIQYSGELYILPQFKLSHSLSFRTKI